MQRHSRHGAKYPCQQVRVLMWHVWGEGTVQQLDGYPAKQRLRKVAHALAPSSAAYSSDAGRLSVTVLPLYFSCPVLAPVQVG